MNNQTYILNNIINNIEILEDKLIELKLKSNNFSDIYYFNNKQDFIIKIYQVILNFNKLNENIIYHEIKNVL